MCGDLNTVKNVFWGGNECIFITDGPLRVNNPLYSPIGLRVTPFSSPLNLRVTLLLSPLSLRVTPLLSTLSLRGE